MNPGDSVQDASRPGLDQAGGLGAVGQGNGTPTRSPRTQKPLQDIQDIIDKLAAVTLQLRHPAGPGSLGSHSGSGSRVAGPST